MQVQTQLISPRYGLSVIGCIQDAISGNYLLTKDKKLSRPEAVALLASIGVIDFSKLPNKNVIDGKEIFSVLLPNDFNFIGKARDDNEVIISNGKLIKGVIDKNNLGEGSGLLLRNLHKKYGPDETMEMIGSIFKLGIAVLGNVGFTTAISDSDLPDVIKKQIDEIITKATDEVEKLIQAFRNEQLDAFPGRSIKETLELKILEILNKARNETGKIVIANSDKNTHTMVMVQSGARGNYLNIAQMAACVGQQAMRGKRIEKGFKNRTLSVFKKDDLGPDAHGFIRNGFKTGLTPYEFFFMGITGRDSLMDTALRTPKSGYLYRRLANALQDLKVEYDHTVRNASKKIIQFSYGEDGIDVSKSEGGIINVKRIVDLIQSER